MTSGDSSDAAGLSARQQAERLEKQAAELHAQADRLAAKATNWRAGEQGETAVAAELDRLSAYGWRILHDRRKSRTSPANIDHIAIGPAGVFVVDAKNWRGKLDVKADSLFCGGQPRRREMETVVDLAVQLREELAADGIVVQSYGVLAMVQPTGMSGPTLCLGGTVADVGRLAVDLLTVPPALDVMTIQRVAARLDYLHPPRTQPVVKQTATRLPAWAAANPTGPRRRATQPRVAPSRPPSKRELRRHAREKAERRKLVVAIAALISLLFFGQQFSKVTAAMGDSIGDQVRKPLIKPTATPTPRAPRR